jgi:hypothetical protein
MTVPRLAASGPKIALPGALKQFANGNSGAGQVTIDWSKGPAQEIILTGNCNFNLYTGLTPGEPTWVQLRVRQDATGGRVPTFSALLTPGGTGLTLSTGALALDIISFYYDGTLLCGTVAGLDFK